MSSVIVNKVSINLDYAIKVLKLEGKITNKVANTVFSADIIGKCEKMDDILKIFIALNKEVGSPTTQQLETGIKNIIKIFDSNNVTPKVKQIIGINAVSKFYSATVTYKKLIELIYKNRYIKNNLNLPSMANLLSKYEDSVFDEMIEKIDIEIADILGEEPVKATRNKKTNEEKEKIELEKKNKEILNKIAQELAIRNVIEADGDVSQFDIEVVERLKKAIQDEKELKEWKAKKESGDRIQKEIFEKSLSNENDKLQKENENDSVLVEIKEILDIIGLANIANINDDLREAINKLQKYIK